MIWYAYQTMARRGLLGPHTHHSRWQRERRRSPEIAAVTIGSKLVRIFKGATHEVECCEGHWLYNSQSYPTLYSVVVAIAGAYERPRKDHTERRSMANWSAARFFKLKSKETQ